ncbi:centromere protein S isoform X2 [Molothrus ater]|uniref:centromere protein S isoform X2 n=1 Tax=Molothrus ater TaxID=84834 RepID=UPI0023E7F018|nr:centromere protein S isoform X2 [Molothrus ater]
MAAAGGEQQQMLTQRLKAAVHYTVGCLCQEVEEDKDVQFSKQSIAAISEITFRQCGTAGLPRVASCYPGYRSLPCLFRSQRWRHRASKTTAPNSVSPGRSLKSSQETLKCLQGMQNEPQSLQKM